MVVRRRLGQLLLLRRRLLLQVDRLLQPALELLVRTPAPLLGVAGAALLLRVLRRTLHSQWIVLQLLLLLVVVLLMVVVLLGLVVGLLVLSGQVRLQLRRLLHRLGAQTHPRI